jgi:hypothetical protein
METYRRIDRESADERWLRERVTRELTVCRLSLIRITNAVAEGKRRIRAGTPKQAAANDVIRWALGPKDPLPPAA